MRIAEDVFRHSDTTHVYLLRRGREAIAIGAGGNGGGAHTLQEWFDPAGRALGLTRILLIALGMAVGG